MPKPNKIFSGDYSRDMWDAVNEAKTKDDLRLALYFVCCRLQELETKMDKMNEKIEYITNSPLPTFHNLGRMGYPDKAE